MSRRIRPSRAATRELIEIAEYISGDDFKAAERFLRAVDEAFVRLAEMPGLGQRRHSDIPRLAALRQWQVPGFQNYLILYLATEDELQILRVLHGARDIDRILEIETDKE